MLYQAILAWSGPFVLQYFLLQETFCRGDVLLRRRFVTGDVLLQETFC
jgi:hypothetical protein